MDRQGSLYRSPGGGKRTADVVAKVKTLTGDPEIRLLHIEPQRRRDRDFPFPVFEYWFLLRRRYRVPVLPIALYLTPGARDFADRKKRGIVSERYAESVFGVEQLAFTYQALGLPDMNAADYYEGDNPLAPALAAIMKDSATGDKVTRRLRILGTEPLRRMDANRRAYLIAFVEKYLAFNKTEQADFERRTQTEEGKNVQKILTEYERRGYNSGKIEGKTEGKAEGIQGSLFLLLETRFGTIAESDRERIARIGDAAELERLFRVALTARDKSEVLPA